MGAGGGAVTVKVARAGRRLLPLLVRKTLAGSVLTKLPRNRAVTSTVTVQAPGVVPVPAGIERPTGKVTVDPAAVRTPVPPQVVLRRGVLATIKPPGKVSVSGEVNVATVALGLLKVIVSVDTPPSVILAGAKLLPIAGGTGGMGGATGGTTAKVARAGRALLPLLVCKAPAGSVLT